MKLLAILFGSVSMLCAKVVVVTDATSDLGMATVKAYDARGWSVWGAVKRLPSIINRISNIQYAKLDDSSENGITMALQKVFDKDQALDAIVITSDEVDSNDRIEKIGKISGEFLSEKGKGHLIYALKFSEQVVSLKKMTASQSEKLAEKSIDVSLASPDHAITFGKQSKVQPSNSPFLDSTAETAVLLAD